jgi:serine/threonine-protein kinase
MIGQTISHYKILEKLGEGGMGVVYLAEDTKLKREVAIKFLPHYISSNEEERKRFEIEAQAAAALNHSNIATIHAIGEADDEIFIVMEYINGMELKDKIKSGPIPASEAINISLQIAEGLEAAHKKGIVHRDIKSQNIMITKDGKVKIMDFGLAKIGKGAQVTKIGSTVGTAAYMSPEQAKGEDLDHQTDIWSFGVVLYEMLTGQLPFKRDYEQAVMFAIVNEQPKPVHKYRDDISSELDHILNRALEKDPEDRYQSVADMLGELRREQKKTAKVTHPSVPNALADVLPADQPVVSSKKRAALLSALGVGMLAVAVVIYLISGHHQTIDSIAVLPFENVGADPNTEYLSDGITESLINALSQLSNLSVMSRSSVFHYKGKDIDPQKVGIELGVKAVLTGRVTQRGDNLQISTELVDVSKNTHIWGEHYNKKLSDILTVQEEISKNISLQLSLKLVGEDENKLTRRSTENTEAYQLYLKGRFYWNKRTADDLQKAVVYFNQAIEKDPGYALAFAGLASTYALLPEYSSLPAKDFIPKTETAAMKALELDATLAEPHAALGLTKFEYQWNWEGAEKEFRRAIELDPNNPTTHHWYSNSLELQAKFEEALSEIKRAQELDPLSLVINNNVAEVLYYMQNYDLAIEQLNRVLELDPNFMVASLTLGQVYAQESKFDEAITEVQKARHILGTNSPYGIGTLGYIYAKAGKKDEAIKTLNQLLGLTKQGYALSVDIASVYAGLGDKDKAFEWLEKGYDEQNSSLGYLKIEFGWDNLRSDPRYTAMLKKIGLEK